MKITPEQIANYEKHQRTVDASTVDFNEKHDYDPRGTEG